MSWPLGKPRSEEIKRKLSLSGKGKNTGKRKPMNLTDDQRLKKSLMMKEIIKNRPGWGKWNIGKPCSEERKKNIGLGNLGKKRSAEFVEQNRKNKLGLKLKLSVEEINRRKLNWIGEKNPKWSGGHTKEYHLATSNSEWDNLRLDILKRDKYRCHYCNKTKTLEVHHIIPWRISKSHHPDNLITLCAKCHRNEDERVRRGENLHNITL